MRPASLAGRRSRASSALRRSWQNAALVTPKLPMSAEVPFGEEVKRSLALAVSVFVDA
jgi:hypothetical protein